MTRDDIIRMAREARAYPTAQTDGSLWLFSESHLERFAALVVAHEREGIAKMIEDAPPLVEFAQNEHGGCMVCGFTPKLAAQAIRARGGK